MDSERTLEDRECNLSTERPRQLPTQTVCLRTLMLWKDEVIGSLVWDKSFIFTTAEEADEVESSEDAKPS